MSSMGIHLEVYPKIPKFYAKNFEKGEIYPAIF
jgi:hypothetical protein